MLNKLKKKFFDFFEGYFIEILKQQEAAKREIDLSKERIIQLENELLQVKSGQQSVYNRIVTTEKNLDYYAMIHSILDENTYVGHELNSLALQKTEFPKILIAGFYGADNFGDEIMLQTLLSAFPVEMLPSVTVMLCDNPDYDYFHLPGVNFIHIPKKTFECNLLAQFFDVLIWGGGALIDDSDFDDDKITLNNLLVLLSKRFIAFQKKVIALGLSTSLKLENSRYLSELKYVCENSSLFTLRDANSLALLMEKGIECVEFLDDLVFFNNSFLKCFKKKDFESVPTIGIIWVCYEELEELFSCLIVKLREKFGKNCKIRCFPFYNYVSLDKNFFGRMLEGVENPECISVAPYTNDIEEMIEQIANTDYMVNMRYHGMLFCGMLQKKTLNICYDTHRHYENKIKYLSDLLHISEGVQSFFMLKKDPSSIRMEFVAPKASPADLIKERKKLTYALLSNLNNRFDEV